MGDAVKLTRRKFIAGSVATFATSMTITTITTVTPSFAAEPAAAWPTRPIHLVVAYPPGGISDGVARALARHVAADLGVAVLVENRAGAGGRIAMEGLSRAAPDGLTLCFSAISPLLDESTEASGTSSTSSAGGVAGVTSTHDLRARVAPVIGVTYTPVLLVATPALDVRSFAEFLVAARAAPGRLRWATSGNGTIGHLVLRQVEIAAGVDIAHVPYKGGGQQLTDALGGQFDLLSTNVGALQLEQIRSGRFKPLAVGSPARLSTLPAVPTFAELGVPQANVASLFGIFAPAGTSPMLLARLNASFDRALKQPDIGRELAAVSNIVAGGSRESFAQQIDRQMQLQRGAFDASQSLQAPRPPRR